MRPHEVELLVDRLLGAFPATRVDPAKVKALWVRRPELLSLDVSVAPTLIDALVYRQYFPSLAEVMDAVRQITSVHHVRPDCPVCHGAGFVHDLDEHGDPVRRPHPLNPDGPAVYVIALPCAGCG